MRVIPRLSADSSGEVSPSSSPSPPAALTSASTLLGPNIADCGCADDAAAAAASAAASASCCFQCSLPESTSGCRADFLFRRKDGRKGRKEQPQGRAGKGRASEAGRSPGKRSGQKASKEGDCSNNKKRRPGTLTLTLTLTATRDGNIRRVRAWGSHAKHKVTDTHEAFYCTPANIKNYDRSITTLQQRNLRFIRDERIFLF